MMGVPALVSIFVTLLGGTMVAADWYDPEQAATDGRHVALVVVHVLLAAAVLILGVTFVLGKSGAVAWATLAAVLGAAAVGVTAYLHSIGPSASEDSGDREGVLPALLVFHGAAAALTILLVVSMALAAR
jgi:hypothetical protein